MRKTIARLSTSDPILNKTSGLMSQQFRTFVLQVHERGLLITNTTELGGTTPEGVIEAQQGVELMVEDGLTGEVKWIKQLADISGDRTQGWVAIG